MRLRSTVLFLLPLLAACGGGSSTPAPGPDAPGPLSAPLTGTWVGALEDRDAFVALVAGEEQVVGYVCQDGLLGEWFVGAPTDGWVELESASGARLEVLLGDEARGQFVQGEVASPFGATPTSDEVLFVAEAVRDDEARVLAGWVRHGERTQGSLSSGGLLQPAPALVPSISLETKLELSPAPMTPSTLSAPAANTTRFVWAAVGDSFGSGEGNPERGIENGQQVENFTGIRWADELAMYIPLTGVTLEEDSLTCHRSDEGGAPKANRELETVYQGVQFKLGFAACSGAQTKHLIDTTYTGPSTTPESRLGKAAQVQPPQLNRVNGFKLAQGRLDALYMSIGGNDMGFGDIISECISPDLPGGDCSAKWEPLLDGRLDTLATNYQTLENRIVALFGNTLPVLISEYPNPLHNGSPLKDPPVCSGTDYDAHGEVGVGGFDDALKNNITAQEAVWAFGISSKLNGAVTAAAQKHGWTRVASHVAAFDGHGLCTGEPFINLNSHALRRQGRDIPDTAFFLFSSGFMHPNDEGFAAYGRAIATSLRPLVDTQVRPGLAAPVNVRVGAAKSGGALTLHWSDRATSESGFEVEVLPARSEDAARMPPPPGATQLAGGGFIAKVAGVGTQQFVHAATGPGRFLYRVRACQAGISSGQRCGPYSAQLLGTNVLPTAPENPRVTTRVVTVLGATQLQSVFAWDAQVGVLEYVARIERIDGSEPPVEKRTASTSVTVGNLTQSYRHRVAACNRVGCSTYRNAP